MISVQRIMGIETEYALFDPKRPDADPDQLALKMLHALHQAAAKAGQPSSLHVPDPRGAEVKWAMLPGAGCRFDYSGEHPQRDARGFDHAELPQEARTDEELGAVLTGAQTRWVTRVGPFEEHYYRGSATHAANGARLYVDHTHPEYASPECLGPFQTALYDRAGDYIMRTGLEALNQDCDDEGVAYSAVLVKNNTDGKGNAWGAHENYLVDRRTDWDLLTQLMIPFLVSRQIIAGIGRVGIGSKSQESGFQIFQRADFIEQEVSLFTTRERPIMNTRDEAHADSSRWRRLHVITADSTILPIATALRMGALAAVLSLIENHPEACQALAEKVTIADPVAAVRVFSRDITLTAEVEMVDGSRRSAWEIQKLFFDAVTQAAGEEVDEETRKALDLWDEALRALAQGPEHAAHIVEWCAKYLLLSNLKNKYQCGWDDQRIAAADLQFSILNMGQSLAIALEKKGIVRKLIQREDACRARVEAPVHTRAGGRNTIQASFPDRVWAASWTSLLLDVDRKHLLRVQLPDPFHPTAGEVDTVMRGKLANPHRHRLRTSATDLITVLEALGVTIPEDVKTYGWDEGIYAEDAMKEQD